MLIDVYRHIAALVRILIGQRVKSEGRDQKKNVTISMVKPNVSKNRPNKRGPRDFPGKVGKGKAFGIVRREWKRHRKRELYG